MGWNLISFHILANKKNFACIMVLGAHGLLIVRLISCVVYDKLCCLFADTLNTNRVGSTYSGSIVRTDSFDDISSSLCLEMFSCSNRIVYNVV